eukprot:11217998-Lingulodinium_polyedra.AAC.1
MASTSEFWGHEPQEVFLVAGGARARLVRPVRLAAPCDRKRRLLRLVRRDGRQHLACLVLSAT